MERFPPMVSFSGPSGSGKTTLLEGVIAELHRLGVRVGVLKHDAHRLEFDKPGKDTWRYRRAGAWRAVIASEEQVAFFSTAEGTAGFEGLVGTLLSDMDIVLAEGWRTADLPALRVHRAEVGTPPDWSGPYGAIAWVSDVPVDVGLPVLPLDDPPRVAEFLIRTFLHAGEARPATLLLFAADPAGASIARALADRVGAACSGGALCVRESGVAPPAGLPSVESLHPGRGLLGALVTGLAAARTGAVLLLGPTRGDLTEGAVDAILRCGPRRSDITAAAVDGRVIPDLAIYGNRCLGPARDALIGGEGSLDGWWSPLRVFTVPVAQTWGNGA